LDGGCADIRFHAGLSLHAQRLLGALKLCEDRPNAEGKKCLGRLQNPPICRLPEVLGTGTSWWRAPGSPDVLAPLADTIARGAGNAGLDQMPVPYGGTSRPAPILVA